MNKMKNRNKYSIKSKNNKLSKIETIQRVLQEYSMVILSIMHEISVAIVLRQNYRHQKRFCLKTVDQMQTEQQLPNFAVESKNLLTSNNMSHKMHRSNYRKLKLNKHEFKIRNNCTKRLYPNYKEIQVEIEQEAKETTE